MKQVYDNLYIGDVSDADNPKQLNQENIEYILNVSGTTTETETAPSYETVKNKNYFHIPLADGRNDDFVLEEAIKLAERLRNQAETLEKSVLIHCSVGVSRSVAIAAAVMSLENERRVGENISRIKKVHSGANPEENLRKQVSKLTSDIYNKG